MKKVIVFKEDETLEVERLEEVGSTYLHRKKRLKRFNSTTGFPTRFSREVALAIHPDLEREKEAIEEMNKKLFQALSWSLEWIDAVPNDLSLPPMPGFDRDYVNELIELYKKDNGKI